MGPGFALAMARAASAHQATTASREQNSQQRAVRTRSTSADPQQAQQGATAAATAAPAALDSLSRLQQLADASPQVAQLRRLQALADDRFAPVTQLAGGPEEEELIQGKFAAAQLQSQLQQAPRANNTGLPDQLKSGIESLSGLSMDHVRVHYNSSQPAQLNAQAYAQGGDIHLAPGQERHLPHEAWHVVQQAQGRVRPTMQMKDGMAVNDDVGLEHEADVMGARAAMSVAQRRQYAALFGEAIQGHDLAPHTPITQRVKIEGTDTDSDSDSSPSSSGLGDIISSLMKILTWLLMAQVVFQSMVPVVGATPLSRRHESDQDTDDPRLLPEIPEDDQLALTPIGYFGQVNEPPPLLVQHNLSPGWNGPRGGTRTDIDQPRDQPRDHSNNGMSLRDYIIWQIFSARRNFGELPKVPRQDMTLMDWLINGPSWLYLPYTHYSPTEVAVFIKHFHIKPALSAVPRTFAKSWTSTMHATVNRLGPETHLLMNFIKKVILRGGYYSVRAYIDLFNEMKATNQEARAFRSDLSSDPWIKNSYRHAFWMCAYARKWSAAFASDLGYAHEYAHLDMTIEGPYDSLIDKINNFWGIKLADRIEQDCGTLVNQLGDQGYLAWAKDYKQSEESGRHLPTLHTIQGPLDALWRLYNELPAFNEHDLGALRALRLQLPGQSRSSLQIEEMG
jgi:hypothetical protein